MNQTFSSLSDNYIDNLYEVATLHDMTQEEYLFKTKNNNYYSTLDAGINYVVQTVTSADYVLCDEDSGTIYRGNELCYYTGYEYSSGPSFFDQQGDEDGGNWRLDAYMGAGVAIQELDYDGNNEYVVNYGFNSVVFDWDIGGVMCNSATGACDIFYDELKCDGVTKFSRDPAPNDHTEYIFWGSTSDCRVTSIGGYDMEYLAFAYLWDGSGTESVKGIDSINFACLEDNDCSILTSNNCELQSRNKGSYCTCEDTILEDSCLDLSLGASCDGLTECSTSFCWGDVVNIYECQSGYAQAGDYSPRYEDCDIDTTIWNSITKECESNIVDNDNDGYNSDVDCDDNVGSGEDIYRNLDLWADSDGDDETISFSQEFCIGDTIPTNYKTSSSLNIDCNDNDENYNSNTLWYIDADSDGYIKGASNYLEQCNAPSSIYRPTMDLINPLVEDCDDMNELYTNNCPNVIDLCDGRVQVHVKDNLGEYMQGLKLYVDGSFEATTQTGYDEVSFNDITCDEDIEFQIKCSDDITSCGVKETEINYDGDEDTIDFMCSMCNNDKDLYIKQEDVKIDGDEVMFNIHSLGISDDVSVHFFNENDEGILKQIGTKTYSVSPGENPHNYTFDDLDNTDYIHIFVDPNNQNKEENNEDNNYIFRPVMKFHTVYIDVEVDESYSMLNEVIRDYLGTYYNVVDNPIFAETMIIVGNQALQKNEDLLSWNTRDKLLIGNLNINMPYTSQIRSEIGIVGEYSTSSKKYIKIFSNSIMGTLAGVKRLVNSKDYMFGLDITSLYVDDYDTMGIQVNDLLKNAENYEHFKARDEELTEIVKDILFDNNFEVSVKPVRTTDETSYGEQTDLRVKHLNSDFSQKYKDALGVSDTPVVMSGGLFSNLDTFEGFGEELIEDGQDVWLLEQTGGPFTDCKNCSDYTYEDLVDYHWPASIAGVLAYSGKDKIQYIGHSNGCRVALSSLHKYSSTGKESVGQIFDYQTGEYIGVDLSSLPVDKFFGIACPSTLNNETIFVDSVRYGGDFAMEELEGTHHLSGGDYFSKILQKGDISLTKIDNILRLLVLWAVNSNDISYNLMSYYNNLANTQYSQINFSGVNVNQLNLYNGYPTDLILNYQDALDINESVTLVDNKKIFSYIGIRYRHDKIHSQEDIRNNIMEGLK